VSALRFSFVLHIHQPVGNFDHVFREHADDVYTPFLDFLDERSLWPIGLHVSGPLLEWLVEHDALLHDRIGRLASDGQVELLSAGWYEPILAALPREDRAEQLGWMREELETRFGVTPTGLWLTERVWEPDLPRDLAEAGIEYALVDDHLARTAGVEGRALQGPLRTEAQGRSVDLLAIDERLRYLIPFRPADEIAEELRSRWAAGDALALIGDDGEKFGGWPRTREWLYDGGWLAAFGDRMDELRTEGIVRWVTPGQARDELEVTGPVYLPTGSYPEMERWALGGHWKGFLARYDESNRMHKRMLALSAMCRERGDPPEARRAIGRAQCNDAYWHGVFGGLYMKHLREGVRGALLRAERSLRDGEALSWSFGDHDVDGRGDWWVHGRAVSAWVDDRYGGTVTDLLWLERGIDVLDVLTRRREAYHEEAIGRATGEGGGPSDSTVGGGDEAVPSIHEVEEEATLDRLPPVDKEPRALVRDRVLDPELELVAYQEGAFEPLWAAGRAHAEDPVSSRDDAGLSWLTWRFTLPAGPRVEKVLALREDGALTLEWSWDPQAFPEGSWFAPELSLGAPVAVELSPEPEVWRYPIVTVSRCPEGFEEIEQGSSLTPRWPVSLGRARAILTPGPP
jgi:4-alpha-glucanotransferase